MRATPDSITLRVNVDSDGAVGKRDLFAAGASLRDAAVVYDQISRIKVMPLAGHRARRRRRLPEAAPAIRRRSPTTTGPTAKPDTDDDLEIGRVNATWSLEEYGVTYDDDDVKFVGAIDQTVCSRRTSTGRTRRAARVATTSATCGSSRRISRRARHARPLKARALLIVTVPLYVKFVPWQTQP